MAGLEQRCCRGAGCRLLGASWLPIENDSSDRRYASLTDFGTGTQQLTAQGRDVQASPSRGGGGGGGSFEAFAGAGNRLGDGGDIQQPVEPMAPYLQQQQQQH